MHMQAIQQAAPSADYKIKVRFGLYMSSLRLLEDRSVEFPFNLNTFINNVASWEALVSAVRAETSASVIWSLVRYAVEKIDFARLGSIALAELKQLSLIATSAGLVYYKFPTQVSTYLWPPLQKTHPRIASYSPRSATCVSYLDLRC